MLEIKIHCTFYMKMKKCENVEKLAILHKNNKYSNLVDLGGVDGLT